LGVSFEPRGTLLRVYNQEGNLVPIVTEFADILADRDRQLEERDQRLSALEAKLRGLRGDA